MLTFIIVVGFLLGTVANVIIVWKLISELLQQPSGDRKMKTWFTNLYDKSLDKFFRVVGMVLAIGLVCGVITAVVVFVRSPMFLGIVFITAAGVVAIQKATIFGMIGALAVEIVKWIRSKKESAIILPMPTDGKS